MRAASNSFTNAVKQKFDKRTAYEQNNQLHPRFAAKVVAQANLQEGWKVLDLACGTGLVAFAAREAVAPRGTVLGIDISPVLLQQAEAKKSRARLSGLTFEEADIEKVDFPNNSFDAILCASALPYVQDIKQALQKYHAWLKDGGILSYNCPEATYTPLLPLMTELLHTRNVKGWTAPMWNMADKETHTRLLKDAGFTSIQVNREVDKKYGLQWPLHDYAKNGWNLMIGFNIWFRIDSLLSKDEQEELRHEFITRAEEIGRSLADECAMVTDAKSFIFTVARK